MRHDFSALDLVRYLYKETSYLETLALEKALRENEALREEFEDLQLSQNLLYLEQEELQPEAANLDFILGYSQDKKSSLVRS